MAPVPKYKCRFNTIVALGIDFTWSKFREHLYTLTVRYTGDNSLELDIVNELSDYISSLRTTLVSIVDCMNNHSKASRSTKLWNISQEGHNYYELFCNIIEECTSRRPINTYGAEARNKDWFIKELLGVNGYLYDILELIHNIKSWCADAVTMIELYQY